MHREKNTCPTVSPSSYTLLVYANNIASVHDKLFASIQKQTISFDKIIFIDDGSVDNTYRLLQDFSLQKPTAIIHQENKQGFLSSIYPVIHQCQDDEVIILLDNCSWFSHENVLKEIKLHYENQDIWLSYFQGEDVHNHKKSCRNITAKTLFASSMKKKAWKHSYLKTFYASLFKQIKLIDLFFRGKIIDTDDAFFFPMMEMAADHGFFHKETGCYFHAQKKMPFTKAEFQVQRYLARRTSSAPLQSLQTSPMLKNVDLLIFSFDRPMQLYALLESTMRYVKNINKIFVVFRTSTHRFAKAYEDVQRTFSHVHFYKQSENPDLDFKPLAMKSIFSNSHSDFILFSVDDLIFKDYVDLHTCIEALNHTRAYSFSLRLGTHLTYCYMGDFSQSVPNHVHINDDIIGWQIDAAQGDWFYPDSVDLTVYRKKDIQKIFNTISFNTPNQLEIAWNKAEKNIKKKTALSFLDSKAVNIPINIVNQEENNKNLNLYTAEELLEKFEQGLKINIDPLYKKKNISVHLDFHPEFIYR